MNRKRTSLAAILLAASYATPLAASSPAVSPQQIGLPYCATELNSTGSPSLLTGEGSLDVTLGDVTLVCADLPVGITGYFLVAHDRGFVANPGGSAGNLCLGGAIGRYAGQIQYSSVLGMVSMDVDVQSIPSPNGYVNVSAGDTLFFQFWHRDMAPGGGATSNISNGLELTFVCREARFPAREFDLGFAPRAQVAVDLDGDGVDEILIAGNRGATTSWVTVLKQRPGMALVRAADWQTPGFVGGMAAADFDGDGDVDVALATWTSVGSLSVHWNDGTGNFDPAPTFPIPGEPAWSVAAIDVDGDGVGELVVGGEDELTVLKWVGGVLVAQSIFAVPGDVKGIGVGDLDGDGDVDIACITSSHAFNRLWVSLNPGTGTFASVEQVDAPFPPDSLIVSNLDGSPWPEIVLAEQGRNRVGLVRWIPLVSGPGWFRILDTLYLPFEIGGSGVRALAAGDVDGDGLPDIMASTKANTSIGGPIGDGVLRIGLTSSGQQLELLEHTPTGSVPSSILLVDLDGDQRSDLIYGHSGARWLVALRGDGSGHFEAAVPFEVGGLALGSSLGDFDGDGDDDLTVSLYASNEIAFLKGFGDGTFATPAVVQVVFAPREQRGLDWTSDGQLDLAVVHGTSSGVLTLSLLPGRGDGTFDPSTNVALAPSLEDLEAGDMDGDGLVDLVLVSDARVMVIRNGGGGPNVITTYPVPGGVDRIALADLDGDGVVDVVAAGAAGAGVHFLRGSAGGVLAAPVLIVSLGAARDVIAGDLDGDGDADLVVVDDCRLMAYRNDGLLRFEPTFTGDCQVDGQFGLHLADIDVDGELDALVKLPPGASVRVYVGASGATFRDARSFHAAGTGAMIVRDLDGVGGPDLVTTGHDGVVWTLFNRGCD